MSDRPHFVLVTDDIDFVLADVFAASRSNAPRWVRVIDDPVEILALPNGTKVHMAVWTSAHLQSGAEIAWRERRLRGGLVFLSDDEMAKIDAWRARRTGRASQSQMPAPPLTVPSPQIQQWT